MANRSLGCGSASASLRVAEATWTPGGAAGATAGGVAGATAGGVAGVTAGGVAGAMAGGSSGATSGGGVWNALRAVGGGIAASVSIVVSVPKSRMEDEYRRWFIASKSDDVCLFANALML